ncbi:MAG: hypothetical protein J5725_10205 [Bacteroidales bacterium]|nr:hypothetical protein [Bacteroidales bacterium]
MKKIVVTLAFLMAFLMVNNASAQTKIKLAHINSTELMKIMPGVDTAQVAIESYAAQL